VSCVLRDARLPEAALRRPSTIAGSGPAPRRWARDATTAGAAAVRSANALAI